MKVLVIAAATYADPHTRKVFDRLAEKGVEIVLAMPRRIKHPFGPAEVPDTPWPTPGVRLVKLDTWYSHENGTHIVMKGIPRLIREVQPDIIHCVMEPWSLTCLEVLACIGRMPRRPTLGVHAAETKPEQGGTLSRYLRQSLYRRVVSRCDYFVGWSSLTIHAASRLGLNGQPTDVAPAVGIDTDLFRPADPSERGQLRSELGASEDDFLVGFVGRFVEEKGVLDLLHAVESARRDASHLKLLMLGSGRLEQDLVTASRDHPWLRVFPACDATGVARFMRAVDTLALPSKSTTRGEEQFGLVLAEAMASGVPVVGSRCGAIPEVVGESGWIVETGFEALRLVLLHAASGRTRVPSDIARRYVSNRFSDEALSGSLMRLWSHRR